MGLEKLGDGWNSANARASAATTLSMLVLALWRHATARTRFLRAEDLQIAASGPRFGTDLGTISGMAEGEGLESNRLRADQCVSEVRR